MLLTRTSAPPLGSRVWLALATLLWAILHFGVRSYLGAHPELGDASRLALAVAPTPFFALALWQFVRLVRTADELGRRMQLEALAVAFPLGILLLATLGLVERAVPLDPADWSYSHVWPFLVFFYVVGLCVARWRYA